MTQQSKITITPSATVYSGSDSVALFRAMTLRAGLHMYAKTGLVPTRGVSATKLLTLAGQITGKKYKRGQYLVAVDDLTVWIETMKAALPITNTIED